MILKSDEIANLLEKQATDSDPLAIVPMPSLADLSASGAAAVDLRLGTWFLRLRHQRTAAIRIDGHSSHADDPALTDLCYVPFGTSYVLHPREFVLGATLEWIRIPQNLAGYVIGRSSWGRRGLIIATAVGVHPGFTGCLTLELSNVGELPIEIEPGLGICQLFLHRAGSSSSAIDRSSFVGNRRPTLGKVRLDPVVVKLREHSRP